MSGIRSKNTKPEILIRKALHARGFRFRLHDKRLPGKPDLVLPKYRAAIFVHGCFWHGHDCHLFKLPKTRTEFWQEKIGKNRERDQIAMGALAEQGWRTAIVWECSLKGKRQLDFQILVSSLEEWLLGKSGNLILRGVP